MKGSLKMPKDREPHEKMTTVSNGLSKTQEVLYQEEFKKADSRMNEFKKETSNKNKQ
jgi:hypothetical protein